MDIGKGEGQWNVKGRLILDNTKETNTVSTFWATEHLFYEIKPYQCQHCGFYKKVNPVQRCLEFSPPSAPQATLPGMVLHRPRVVPSSNLHNGSIRGSSETASRVHLDLTWKPRNEWLSVWKWSEVHLMDSVLERVTDKPHRDTLGNSSRWKWG